MLSALRGLGVKNAVMLTGDSPAPPPPSRQSWEWMISGRVCSRRTRRSMWLRCGVRPYRPHGGRRHQRLPGSLRGGRRHRHQRRGGHRSEIADITIAADSLWELVRLRQLAMALMRRIQNNYRFVIGFNGALIGLGVAGILPPTTSAMLHNLSTLG